MARSVADLTRTIERSRITSLIDFRIAELHRELIENKNAVSTGNSVRLGIIEELEAIKKRIGI